jgi:hypothetical protein
VEHRRSAISCDVRDPLPLQGLTEDQRELLKPRDRNRSEEERWKTVYKICFPADQIIPSPCESNYIGLISILPGSNCSARLCTLHPGNGDSQARNPTNSRRRNYVCGRNDPRTSPPATAERFQQQRSKFWTKSVAYLAISCSRRLGE